MRGLRAYCTACGGERDPSRVLGGTVVNVAGKPSRIGATVSKVLAWVAMIGSMSLGTFIWAMASWLWPGSPLPGVGIFIGLFGLAVGAFLLFASRKLRRTGEGAERDARIEALTQYAAQRGGLVSATDVARALSIDEASADALLTELAKDPSAHVGLEIDDAGNVLYSFTQRGARFEAPRYRVGDPGAGPDALADEEASAAEHEARIRAATTVRAPR